MMTVARNRECDSAGLPDRQSIPSCNLIATHPIPPRREVRRVCFCQHALWKFQLAGNVLSRTGPTVGTC